MKVLIAVDKFKGTLSGKELSQALLTGLQQELGQGFTPEICPIADGGDGTVDAALAAGFHEIICRVTGPLPAVPGLDTVEARYAFDLASATAVIEIAQAGGIWRLSQDQLDAENATSFGAGELVKDALERGVRSLVIGVGGSASTDGGAGLLQALGVSLQDATGAELAPGGGALGHLASVDVSGFDGRLTGVDVTVACDVTNPLTGVNGAAAVYGPQKGADARQVELLDKNLQKLADAVENELKVSRGTFANAPGAGAAGGLGFACLSVLGATMRPGTEVCFELTGFNQKLPGADVVITGEGKLDTQTLQGKGPAGVAKAASQQGAKVLAVCGANELDRQTYQGAGFAEVYSLLGAGATLQEALANPRPWVEKLGAAIARDYLL
ncbi:MAG: glycerate kinase [Rothia sp. (in: high G+C Gram-positive bacteria)]|nr:glycerate kinase [Rothia sp. (in: high G+C Gram-positive bacteria)]